MHRHHVDDTFPQIRVAMVVVVAALNLLGPKLALNGKQAQLRRHGSSIGMAGIEMPALLQSLVHLPVCAKNLWDRRSQSS